MYKFKYLGKKFKLEKLKEEGNEKMSIRTDLAIELSEGKIEEKSGIHKEERQNGDVLSTSIKIFSEKGEKIIGKPQGTYITLSFPSIDKIDSYEEIKKELIKALKSLIPQNTDNILVVGLGNDEITSDSIGPKTAKKLLATRHIAGDFAEKIGLKGLKSVSVVTPNVLGKTGIEVTEIIEGIVKKTKAGAVIVIDALASGSITRLFKTIQLCNTGISPGSGVKNSRKELSEKTLGVPVIAVGVPTVVDALSLAFEITEEIPKNDTDMIVTPKDADLLCHRMSEILSLSLNLFLQPEIEPDILMSMV